MAAVAQVDDVVVPRPDLGSEGAPKGGSHQGHGQCE